MDSSERARRCQAYVDALEAERRKIQVFARELPLCLQLVNQAIESAGQAAMGAGVVSEEAASDDRPVLEEFLPLRPTSSTTEEGSLRDQPDQRAAAIEEERSDTKPDWLRSVQLWNQDPDPLPKAEPPRKPVAVNARRIGGAFHPFAREKHAAPAPAAVPAAAAAAASSSTGGGGGGGGEEKEKEKEGQSQPHRKARRCWSPELHRRFLHALQQLGGSHAATPKQIRELMKVDGLTNDEVKSHLQKYRLHNRRPSPAVQSGNNNSNSSSSNPAPQLLLVGGIWVPPQDYAAAAAAIAAASQPAEGTGAPPKAIYAPVASLPSEFRFKQQQQPELQNRKQSHRSPIGPLHSEGRCSGDDYSLAEDGATNSDSPTNSSSSQTTTASPPYSLQRS